MKIFKPFLDRLSPEELLHVCSWKAFQAICQYHQVLEPFNQHVVSHSGPHSLWRLRNSLSVDWSSLRLKDPFVDCVLIILHRTQSLDQLRSDNAEFVWIFRERSHLVLKDGILYRQRTVENNEKLYFMPNSLKPCVLRGFHNELGHLSRD